MEGDYAGGNGQPKKPGSRGESLDGKCSSRATTSASSREEDKT